MTFSVPAELEREIDELITHYPQKRSASISRSSSAGTLKVIGHILP